MLDEKMTRTKDRHPVGIYLMNYTWKEATFHI